VKVEGSEERGLGEEKKDGKDKDKWIRKIRMGTFEDTGNCKGWAFIDFTSIEHATAALVNPKNHRLDGRNLVVEYASPDAVRRGGGGPRPRLDERAGPRQGSSRGGRTDRGVRGGGGRGVKEDRGSNNSQARVEIEPDNGATNAEITENMGPTHAEADKGGYKGVKGRSKPGAALAMAKRESAAIVPSRGKKITF